MFDVLTFWHAFTGAFDWLPIPERFMGLPAGAVSISAIFSGSGAIILGKFTSNVGIITMPLNYCVLLVGALASNWAFQEATLPLGTHLQTSIIYTVTGMTLAALSMLCFLRPERD